VAAETLAAYRAAMDAFALHDGAAAVYRLISATNEYIAQTEPWTLAKQPDRSILASTVSIFALHNPVDVTQRELARLRLGKRAQLAQPNEQSMTTLPRARSRIASSSNASVPPGTFSPPAA